MKKTILIALLSIGLMGCNEVSYDSAIIYEKIDSNEDELCRFSLKGSGIGNIYLYDCPCDKYKIGDNPFKSDSL